MYLIDKYYSSDRYFKLGLTYLLTPEFIENEEIQLIDMDTINVLSVKDVLPKDKELIFFASNDIDYYIASSIFKARRIKIIDRKCFWNEFLSCVIAGNENYSYRVKYKLSEKELMFLFYLFSELNNKEIMEKLNISIKTFYTIRQALIRKLQLKNRIALYYYILKYKGVFFRRNTYKVVFNCES